MRNLILPFILLLTFVFSCRENEAEGLEQKNASYDVYIAGQKNGVACYWKNGNRTDLTNGSGITAVKILVENNDIYVFAISNSGPSNYYFWKNNVKVDIHQYIGLNINTTNQSDYFHNINDFLVDQGNVYFFGSIKSPTVQIPSTWTYTKELCYWKNGVKTVLFTENPPFTQQYVTTRNFTIYNGDVYIPVNKMLNNFIDAPVEVGYFKNNIYTVISPFNGQKNFMHISSNSSGVYLSINDKLLNNTFYKNISSNNDLYISQSVKGRFKIDGNDIYDFSNGQNYLKNDILTVSNYASGFNNIEDLYALDQNVYQIRSNYINDKKEAYKAYINNTEIQHIDISDGIFNSIFVKQN
ncbi:hypothetical protein [Chryseobacterium echinoideorum]|uniref:hypothetical protein n=1 Tax=Chryseobacterium echinoideorum TaxID=1549648 RepID=UPI001185A717|nr:hypothetical protein [Chryseobacterium echinoideorum]